MRSPTLLALFALAVPSLAQVQIPIPPFSRSFTAQLTRGFYFQAPSTFVITGLRVPDEGARGLQVVEVIDFGTSPPPAFAATVLGTQMFYSNGQPSANIIPCSVTCVAGNYYGVLGACGDATSVTNSYAAPGPFTGTLFGNSITLTRMGTQFNIAATGGNNPVWSEAAFEVSRVEVYVAPPTGYALATPYGSGCRNAPGTKHEFFASAPSFDLSGSSMTLIYNGSDGYIALPGLTPYAPPGAGAQTLTLSDDSEQTVTLASPLPYPGGSTSALTVCSNGFISVASGNGVAFTPSEASFFAFPQTVWSSWHDYNPAAGGAVRFEQVGTRSIVTWDGVPDFGGTAPNTFQFQFDRASGQVDIIWQSITGAGNAHLVGFKCGGPATTVPSIDISALLPATFNVGCDVLPLSLAASARPVIGTNLNLVTSRIPAGATITVHRLTFTQAVPGFDLTPLGAPGCFAHVDVIGPDNLFLVGSPTTTSPFNVPNNQSFAGTRLYAQSASFVPGINAFGILTSNGLELVVDVN